MRYCPRCTQPLRRHVEGEGREIDLCERCGGGFVGHGDLARSLDPKAAAGRWVESGVAKAKGPSKLLCPAHVFDERPNMIAFDVGRDDHPTGCFEIDTCPSCGGTWLDRDEGAKLRRLAEVVAAERQAAADEEFVRLVRMMKAEELTVLAVRQGVTRHPVVTWVFAAITAFLFVLDATSGGNDVGKALQLSADTVASRPWTLVTHGFVHANLFHFGNNLFYFLGLSLPVELYIGKARFTALYLIAIVVGGLGHLLTAAPEVGVVGASGGVAGVMAAFMLLMPKTKVGPDRRRAVVGIGVGMVTWILLQLWLAVTMPMIAWSAHLGGFAAGLTFGGWFVRGDAVR